MITRTTAFAALALLATSGCTTVQGEAGSRIGGATVTDAAGRSLGTAAFYSRAGEVALSITLEGLPPGAHGVHLHAIGDCRASGFTSAGGHLNPDGSRHGSNNPQGAHLGDLPNINIAADGTGSMSAVLQGDNPAGLANVFDADGTAIVVHAGADDYSTDPDGSAGNRIACGVFARG